MVQMLSERHSIRILIGPIDLIGRARLLADESLTLHRPKAVAPEPVLKQINSQIRIKSMPCNIAHVYVKEAMAGCVFVMQAIKSVVHKKAGNRSMKRRN
jgi:hypothetical protein